MAAMSQSSSSSRRRASAWCSFDETTLTEAKSTFSLVSVDVDHGHNALADATAASEADRRPLVRRKPKHQKRASAVLRSVVHKVLSCSGGSEPPTLLLGTKIVGTLFGHRKGHVHVAFQSDPGSTPAMLVELTTPTFSLIREMASGLVRIALECERQRAGSGRKVRSRSLLEEPVWKTYCNGRKSGQAVARECTLWDMGVLRSVQAISMGAGVLPGPGSEGDLMYMRARFERAVGSRDSESFYMMNPESTGGPELSFFLLRV